MKKKGLGTRSPLLQIASSQGIAKTKSLTPTLNLGHSLKVHV